MEQQILIKQIVPAPAGLRAVLAVPSAPGTVFLAPVHLYGLIEDTHFHDGEPCVSTVVEPMILGDEGEMISANAHHLFLAIADSTMTDDEAATEYGDDAFELCRVLSEFEEEAEFNAGVLNAGAANDTVEEDEDDEDGSDLPN